jgi:hypothetical protein
MLWQHSRSQGIPAGRQKRYPRREPVLGPHRGTLPGNPGCKVQGRPVSAPAYLSRQTSPRAPQCVTALCVRCAAIAVLEHDLRKADPTFKGRHTRPDWAFCVGGQSTSSGWGGWCHCMLPVVYLWTVPMYASPLLTRLLMPDTCVPRVHIHSIPLSSRQQAKGRGKPIPFD